MYDFDDLDYDYESIDDIARSEGFYVIVSGLEKENKRNAETAK